jgi:predicted ester cyclase
VQTKKLYQLPYLKSATLAVVAEARDISSYTARRGFGFTIGISNTGNKLSFQSGVINDICNEACQHAGVDIDRCEVTWRDSILLLDFEFPARLNGAMWNWQPQYT